MPQASGVVEGEDERRTVCLLHLRLFSPQRWSVSFRTHCYYTLHYTYVTLLLILEPLTCTHNR
jgi:hypothetical protein